MAPEPERPWQPTEPETLDRPQEEFISEEARPSVDIASLRCAWCGKPGLEWSEPGVKRGGHYYCSHRCADEAQPDPDQAQPAP
jgi:hypothetical protein